jgi:hypothetical protein
MAEVFLLLSKTVMVNVQVDAGESQTEVCVRHVVQPEVRFGPVVAFGPRRA